jgi:multicomponent Na+:H+ antiporter subunit B
MSKNLSEKFNKWLNGEAAPDITGYEVSHAPVSGEKKKRYIAKSDAIKEHAKHEASERRDLQLKRFRMLCTAVSVVACVSLLAVLLYTISFLPPVGDPNDPANNEVTERYIEKGLEETGAVNIVAGMILDYRAFDTFGESCVLFIASCCVFIMLKTGDSEEEKKRRLREIERDHRFEPRKDTILRNITRVLFPIIMIFGIYVVLNGHISPGGGFSGGAVMGAGLILYLSAFGYQETHRFINEKTVKWTTFVALTFYCLAKSYSFFTGANHLESGIPKGTPGAILSSGLILPLNICVGLIVACTMYAFYSLFRKGSV